VRPAAIACVSSPATFARSALRLCSPVATACTSPAHAPELDPPFPDEPLLDAPCAAFTPTQSTACFSFEAARLARDCASVSLSADSIARSASSVPWSLVTVWRALRTSDGAVPAVASIVDGLA
jgi:hypothetical protein